MFSWILASRGISPSGISATIAVIPSRESRQPIAAPAIASSRLSTSSCRTRRVRLAPRAARTAISCSRPAARLSSMLATLVHAISSSIATAAAIV